MVLNELGRRSLTTLRALAPAYAAYRDPVADPTLGGSQSLNNVVMWRTDRWNLVDGGRVEVVDDDRGYFRRRPFVWDRYLSWAVLQDKRTGAVLPVVATHLPTNPARVPQQPGRPTAARISARLRLRQGLGGGVPLPPAGQHRRRAPAGPHRLRSPGDPHHRRPALRGRGAAVIANAVPVS